MTSVLRSRETNSEITNLCIKIATNTGLSISIFFLCVHLLIFTVVDDLRNLPGKNLASFCVALVLEYSSTLISGVLEGNGCYVNEIAAYYFIMASAFWMLTMSYDVWQTLRSTNDPVTSSGGQCRKFVYYSLFAWLMPALFTISVFFVLPRIFEDFDLAYQDFDRKECSFKETDMMYIFVTSVFGTILLLNTYFFASSVYYIFSTQSAVSSNKNSRNSTFITHFRLYGRLSLIMGVTWTAEFIIYYSDFDILSHTFKIINTFEGFFIVAAFTIRKDVLDSVKSLSICKLFNSDLYRYMTVRRL